MNNDSSEDVRVLVPRLSGGPLEGIICWLLMVVEVVKSENDVEEEELAWNTVLLLVKVESILSLEVIEPVESGDGIGGGGLVWGVMAPLDGVDTSRLVGDNWTRENRLSPISGMPVSVSNEVVCPTAVIVEGLEVGQTIMRD